MYSLRLFLPWPCFQIMNIDVDYPIIQTLCRYAPELDGRIREWKTKDWSRFWDMIVLLIVL